MKLAIILVLFSAIQALKINTKQAKVLKGNKEGSTLLQALMEHKQKTKNMLKIPRSKKLL